MPEREMRMVRPMTQLHLHPGVEIVVDNFAGGGGASLGIEAALRRPIDIAINHDAEAIALHQANHPATRHVLQDLWDVDPLEATGGRPVGLAWFSPDCKHFSKAKGGKPVEKRIRSLAWVVVRWAARVRPRVIILENVEEFRTWGPLRAGRPCPRRKGMTFTQWVGHLKALGYVVDWRELRACDYGSPTIRKRLFVVARRDGEPIKWPEPTHGPGLLPFHTAAECIDWSLPCPSIFERKRPLVENTLRRIARGVQRFVVEAAEPFIVGVGGRMGQSPPRPVGKPYHTTTSKADSALVMPYVVPVTHSKGGNRAHPIDEPLRTVTTAPRGEFALCAPFLTPYYGPKSENEDRSKDADAPLPTMSTENRFGLVSAFLAQHNGGAVGRDARKPLATSTVRSTQIQTVAVHFQRHFGRSIGHGAGEPCATAASKNKTSLVSSELVKTGGMHTSEVRAFLLKYYGTAVGQDAREPLHSVTGKARFGLVMIEGEEWQIADIGMRMLTPRELFRAQGFGEGYLIDPDLRGKPLTKTAQIRLVGNSVCPQVAQAVVEANFVERGAVLGVGAQ